MGDENFERTVILLCEHNDNGSFGLVLNQGMSLTLSDVIDDNYSEQPLFTGGPVQQNTLHFLHRLGAEVEQTTEVAEDIYWGGNFEYLKTMLNFQSKPHADVRLFIGYSGWSESQLKEEYTLCLDENNNPLEPMPFLDTGLLQTEYSFSWYKDVIRDENRIPDATTNNYSPNSPGTYFVVLENLEFGCEFSIFTKVTPITPPTLFEIVPTSDLFSGTNSINIQVEGGSDYLFSVDDSVYSTTSQFNNLDPGEPMAYVTDTNNCTVLSKPFLVVDYPRFFTPNGDGINDIWNIVGLSEIEDAKILIYDRFGKLRYQFNDKKGWNGTSNSQKLPPSDYWFTISYTMNGERKEFKNHFSLKR